jgi:hypothetical protein
MRFFGEREVVVLIPVLFILSLLSPVLMEGIEVIEKSENKHENIS